MGLASKTSSDFADSQQFLILDNLDFSAISGNEFLRGKGRKRADGIARGHVRKTGKVFAAQVDAERTTILFHTITVHQE